MAENHRNPVDANEVDEELEHRKNFGKLFWTKEFADFEDLYEYQNYFVDTYDSYCDFIRNFEADGHGVEDILNDLMNPENYPHLNDNHHLTLNGLIRHTMLLSNISITILQNVKYFILWRGINQFNIRYNNEDIPYTIHPYQNNPNRNQQNGLLSISDIGFNRDLNPLIRENLRFYPFYREVLIILFFGSKIDIFRDFITFQRGNMVDFLGRDEEFNEFLKKRYIFISNQMIGKQNEILGNVAQKIVETRIRRRFDNAIRNQLLIIRQAPRIDDINIEFDMVIEIGNIIIAVETAFQETGNSTIERKGRQSELRYPRILEHNHYMVHIFDGMGAFRRGTGFTKKILQFSDYGSTFGEDFEDFLNWLEVFIHEQFPDGVNHQIQRDPQRRLFE